MIATSLALAVVVSAVPVQEAPAPGPAPKATASAPAWPAPAEAPAADTEDSKQEDTKPEDTKDTETATPVIPFQAPTTAPPAKPAPATTAQSPWSFAGWLLYADPEQQTGSFAPSMFGGTAPGTTQASSSPWWALTPLNFLFGVATQLAPEQTNPAPETPATEPAPAPEATGTPEPVSVADLIPSGTATSTTAGAEGDAGDDTASAPAATETATK